MKNSNDTSWDRTNDLLICSAAPWPLCYPTVVPCSVHTIVFQFTLPYQKENLINMPPFPHPLIFPLFFFFFFEKRNKILKAKGGTFLRRESCMNSATIPQTPDSNIWATAVYLETHFDLTQLLRANSGMTSKNRIHLSLTKSLYTPYPLSSFHFSKCSSLW